MAAKSGLRFADVQFALDVSDISLRNWLKRGQATIETPYGGGWSTFTLKDVAHLALVRIFVDLGRRVEEANDLAEATAKLIRKATDAPKDADPDAIWRGKMLYVIRKGGVWKHLGIIEQGVHTPGALIIDVYTDLTLVMERVRSRLGKERQAKVA